MSIFPPHATDGYKTGHIRQYPEGTEYVYSNLTFRSDKHAKVLKDFDHKIVWFGAQAVVTEMRDLWQKEFFDKPRAEVVARYARRMDAYLGAGVVSSDHIGELHDLGYLPLRIKSLPEGSRVNIRVPVLTIINTNPKFYWLTNYIETYLSAELWKAVTSATSTYEFRRLFEKYAGLTGVDKNFVDFQGHNFADRGMSGIYDARSSGAGHLLSFKGTDSILAIDYIEEHYMLPEDEAFIGGSVPATEHSVICMGGQDDELGTIRRLINDVYPAGIVSIVSDTWDFFDVVTTKATILKDEILYRNGKVVFRPDSGDPATIICGIQVEDLTGNKWCKSLDDAKDHFEETLVEFERAETPHGECGDSLVDGYFKYDGIVYKMTVEIEWNRHDKQYYYEDGHTIASCDPVTLTPEQKGAVECLWDIFGGTVNDAGFKTLDQHVGLIYGDSISLEVAEDVFKRLIAKGFSSANIVFGIGSFTYQYVTRDSFGAAVKATWGQVNGEGRELFKNPKTDSGMKKSAKGLLRVEKEGDDFVLYDQQTPVEEGRGRLRTIFEDSVLLRYETLTGMRERLLSPLTPAERFEKYKTGLEEGKLSVNDVRVAEGFPPVEGGEGYFVKL